MQSNIAAHEYPLAKIFANDFRYLVPNYQRPYSWEWEHARELFEDVRDASLGESSSGSVDDYFLGCIVIVKSDGNPESQLVDGQQRLTTLTMLLCALRDVVHYESPERATAINDYVWQTGDWTQNIEDVARLTLRDKDNAFFRQRVQELGVLLQPQRHPSPKTETQERILDNATRLVSAVKGLENSEREHLITYLVTRCYLVVVSTKNRSAANRIFGVLNTRGMDLSPTDILKSVIAESASDDHVRRWEELEDGIGRDEFRSLFTHIYTIKTKTRNRTALEDAFMRDVLGGEFDSDEFIDDVLDPYADTYEKLIKTEFDRVPEADRYLRSLRLVDNSDWMPSALRFVERHGESPDLLLPFVRDLERLAYWMFIRRVWRDARVRRYVAVLGAIDNGHGVFEPGSPLQLDDAEKNELVCALQGDFHMNWARQVLLKLDGLHADADAQYRHPVISVEHVLPQNPGGRSHWLESFPNEETRRRWTWKLANLVLLSRRKNSKAGNGDFDDKKRTYFARGNSTSFQLTQSVINETEWTPEVLQRRQEHLVGMLAKEGRLTE